MSRGCARGCAIVAVVAVVLTGAAYAGFRWGDGVFPTMERWLASDSSAADEPQPSPSLAEATLARVEALQAAGGGEERLVLGGAEISSVIRYSFPGLLPDGVTEPTVAFRGDDLLLSARVVVASFPDLPALGEVLGLLPDTVNIEMRGALIPFGPRVAALHVERVEASRIPLPARMVPGILAALGRTEREGLPSDAMAISLPGGITSAYVQDDHLILVAEG